MISKDWPSPELAPLERLFSGLALAADTPSPLTPVPRAAFRAAQALAVAVELHDEIESRLDEMARLRAAYVAHLSEVEKMRETARALLVVSREYTRLASRFADAHFDSRAGLSDWEHRRP